MAARQPTHNESSAVFVDRRQAGALLGERLGRYRGKGALVFGIPRGGVPVAAAVADAIQAELDVVVAHKVGAPFSRELAIGAVTANGGQFIDHRMIREFGISKAYLARAVAAEMAEARQREERLRRGRPLPPIAGRTVIIVDDGLATGATMRAAVRSVRRHQPARVVVAVPVGAAETCAALADEADEVVCLDEPEPFYAVGLYYQHFEPVEDEEVQRLLERAAAAKAPGAPAVAEGSTPATAADAETEGVGRQ